MEKNTNYTIESLRNELNNYNEELIAMIVNRRERVSLINKLCNEFDQNLISQEKYNEMCEVYLSENEEDLKKLAEIPKNHRIIEDIVYSLLTDITPETAI